MARRSREAVATGEDQMGFRRTRVKSQVHLAYTEGWESEAKNLMPHLRARMVRRGRSR